MIFAVIPAGGRSERMGQPKLLLPLAGRTVLEHVITAIQASGIERILVVAASDLSELITISRVSGADAISLPTDTPDMRSTVEFGLSWVEANWFPLPDDAWLLIPADHPAIEADVIRELLRARQLYPAQSIFVPTFAGQRGHPTLIGWQHVAAIRAFPPNEGLNAYLRSHLTETREVPVQTPSILWDLDTPEDYARLRATRIQG